MIISPSGTPITAHSFIVIFSLSAATMFGILPGLIQRHSTLTRFCLHIDAIIQTGMLTELSVRLKMDRWRL